LADNTFGAEMVVDIRVLAVTSAAALALPANSQCSPAAPSLCVLRCVVVVVDIGCGWWLKSLSHSWPNSCWLVLLIIFVVENG